MEALVVLLHDELVIEIFCHMSVRELQRLKCVCKHWNRLISESMFLRFYHNRSSLGLFIQQHRNNLDKPHALDYFSYEPTTVKSFIPYSGLKLFYDKTATVLSSSNGLVCCRKGLLEIFVYNPATMETVALKPMASLPHLFIDSSLALAFFPFGFSSNMVPSFKVLCVRRTKSDPKAYSFMIYSSETGEWKRSRKVCCCKYNIQGEKHVSVYGRFYWMTTGNQVIAFDIEQGISGVMELPGPVLQDGGRRRACLGSADECLHYVCADASKIGVWSLKDHCRREWVCKYWLDVDQFHIQPPYQHLMAYSAYWYARKETHIGIALRILAFCDDVVYMMAWGVLYSFDLRTKRLENLAGPLIYSFKEDVLPTALLYTPSLAAVGFLKKNGCLSIK